MHTDDFDADTETTRSVNTRVSSTSGAVVGSTAGGLCEHRLYNDEPHSLAQLEYLLGIKAAKATWTTLEELRLVKATQSKIGEAELLSKQEFLQDFGPEQGLEMWEAAPRKSFVFQDTADQASHGSTQDRASQRRQRRRSISEPCEYRQIHNEPVSFQMLVEDCGDEDEAKAIWQTAPLLRLLPAEDYPEHDHIVHTFEEFVDIVGDATKAQQLWDAGPVELDLLMAVDDAQSSVGHHAGHTDQESFVTDDFDADENSQSVGTNRENDHFDNDDDDDSPEQKTTATTATVNDDPVPTENNDNDNDNAWDYLAKVRVLVALPMM